MSPLTDQQSRVLAFIVCCQDNGWTPTVREIAAEFDIGSPNGVMCHLNALEKKHYITRQRMRTRRITVLDDNRAETIWGPIEL